MTLITLSGAYGYNVYRVGGLEANSVINATNASWILANSANQYPDANTSTSVGSDPINPHPFIIDSAASGLLIRGGTFLGQVPQTSDWAYTYNNSAAMRIDGAPNFTIDGGFIDRAWDGIRIRGNSGGFLIDDVCMSNVRDDAIENDFALSGTVRDSLFDGVFVGMGLTNSTNPDASANTITFENVMMRSQTYLYNGDYTHGAFFKMNTDAPATAPDLRLINSVFAIEDVTPIHLSRLKLAWDSVVESHGNVFLNLSDKPLPSDYPLPKSGFTILQGQEARDYWAKCKAAWLDNHDGTPFADVTPLPALPGATSSPAPAPAPAPTPDPTPAPAPAPAPTTGTVINGTDIKNTLYGTAGNDTINGFGGDDKLFAHGGSDVLSGGSGRDKFVFDAALGDGVDTITDFNTTDDWVWLDNAIFAKLGTGSLSAPVRLNSSYFVAEANAHAHDSNDFVLYDKNTGVLSYDADGNGSGAAVEIAHLAPNLNLTHYDIYVC